MDVDEDKKKSLDEEQVKATTPVTATKEKEEKIKDEGGEEEGQKATEEEEKKKKREGEVKGEEEAGVSMMKNVFNYVQLNTSQFPFLIKQTNLEKNGPTWNEKARRESEKESLKNLLLTMCDKIKEFVVNHAVEHAFTFFDHNKNEITRELSLLKFVDRFLKKVEAYKGGRMSPLLVEQCESFLNFLIESRSHVDVKCVINEIDDTFGSAEMMKLFLTMMQELVDGQDREEVIVKFSEESTRNLKEALGFMKVFKDTGDEKVRKYCCILMFFILTTDVYVENMRRASWVEALFKKIAYLGKHLKKEAERIERGSKNSRAISQPVIDSMKSELELLEAVRKDERLRNDKGWFDEIANVIGFVFNTAKVFHLISKAYDKVYKDHEEKAKVDFLTKLLDKVSEKYMDKGNEKALAGNTSESSTGSDFIRDANVAVIMPLDKFDTCCSDENDEQIKYFWKIVRLSVSPMETFLSDQLLFDITYCCRDLRVKQKEKRASGMPGERGGLAGGGAFLGEFVCKACLETDE